MRRFSPSARMLCGISAFSVCLIAPVAHPWGLGAVAATIVVWTFLTRPPVRVTVGTVLFGLAIFLPYYLLTPLIRAEGLREDGWSSLAVPSAILVRGIGAMASAAFMVTTVTMSDFRRGISDLPLPGIVKAILIQIVHQSATLLYETRRIARAISVRGGTTGFRTALAMAVSLPSVWLPRIVDRAERVANAMTLRGYCQEDVAPAGAPRRSPGDIIALAVSFAWLLAVVCLRFAWGDR